ncbi:hypothetical protein D3C71_2011400 [compost metagenome]
MQRQHLVDGAFAHGAFHIQSLQEVSRILDLIKSGQIDIKGFTHLEGDDLRLNLRPDPPHLILLAVD